MLKRCRFILLSLAFSFFEVSSFLLYRQNAFLCDREVPQRQTTQFKSRIGDAEEGDTQKIPQLPVPGSSSFHQNRLKTSSSQGFQSGMAFVSRKFELQYTCNVCETRNFHMVSRLAYTEGVVVATCKGCNSKHMIADNLGTAGLDGDNNIEEYFKTRGMEENVNRVNREVFDLEKVLSVDTKGGSLVGENGDPVLE